MYLGIQKKKKKKKKEQNDRAFFQLYFEEKLSFHPQFRNSMI